MWPPTRRGAVCIVIIVRGSGVGCVACPQDAATPRCHPTPCCPLPRHTQDAPCGRRSCRLGLQVRSLLSCPRLGDVGTSVMATSAPEAVGPVRLVLDVRHSVRLAAASDLAKVCVSRGGLRG